MKICFLGLFDTDPIITGGTGGETKTPPKRTSPCVDPGQGKPAYDQVVLSTLHGEGEISRADYDKINFAEVERRVGQLAGRTFLELTTGKGGSESSVEKAHVRRRAAEYKKAIDQIKVKPIINPQLK